MRTKLTKVNQVIRDRGDTKYSQTENSQNQAAQEGLGSSVSYVSLKPNFPATLNKTRQQSLERQII